MRYGIEYWHPWFGWMYWEDGDKTYSKDDASIVVSDVKRSGGKARAVAIRQK